ncbi:MFS transporter [Paracoccus niistensis]|uniref:MFS transporter n=1 Tax=Paracoccus niistensis TaxID=632935 RepID=A0ABV6I1Y6_9RHOB
MLSVLRTTWPLLLGVLLLMVGNGMQGTLLGIRGEIEGIPTTQMSVVMSGYFGGFVLGSLIVPGMIQRVGHVRVFAALASLISAVLIVYAAIPHWLAWALMRLLIGFCFCGVYITAESWVNASAANETRGQAMSAYFIVQMLGLVTGQVLMNVSDPGGWMLFVIPSVLVSVAFTPILLARVPAPRFETIKPMSMGQLYRASPLGCVGIFLIGGVFSAVLGMGAVWAATIGLNVREISAFVAAIWIGGLLAQYPIGWLSDRVDRRLLITGLAAFGTLVTATFAMRDSGVWGYLLAAALVGGVANPIYALLIAYTNDFLDTADMAAASAGLLLINGAGSVFGPILTGWLMAAMGPEGFWVYMAVLLAGLAAYGGWRMTQRATPDVDQSFAILSPSATPLAVETALAEAGDNSSSPPQDKAA